MLGHSTKTMLKKRNLCFFIIILMVFSLGCINHVVSVDLPNEIILNKNTASTIGISYKSVYPERQIVTISLNSSDPGLGISLSQTGSYQKTLSFTEEVGKNYLNSKNIYVTTIDSSIPPGDYVIVVGIIGDKSKESDWVAKSMIVHLKP